MRKGINVGYHDSRFRFQESEYTRFITQTSPTRIQDQRFKESQVKDQLLRSMIQDPRRKIQVTKSEMQDIRSRDLRSGTRHSNFDPTINFTNSDPASESSLAIIQEIQVRMIRFPSSSLVSCSLARTFIALLVLELLRFCSEFSMLWTIDALSWLCPDLFMLLIHLCS